MKTFAYCSLDRSHSNAKGISRQIPCSLQTQIRYLPCKQNFSNIKQEGELKANIDGADYTKIESCVALNIPSLDE